MSRRAIRYLGRKSARHPYLILAIVSVLTVLAGLVARKRLEIVMDVAAMLPSDSAVAQTAARAWEDFGGYDFMLAILEVKPDAPREVRENPAVFLKGIAREVRDVLYDKRFFNQITFELHQNDLGLGGSDAALVALLTEQDLNHIEDMLLGPGLRNTVHRVAVRIESDPTTETLSEIQADPFELVRFLKSASQVIRGPLKLNAKEGYFISDDGEMLLLLLWPGEPFTRIDVGRRMNEFLEQTRRGLYIRNPEWRRAVNISFTGQHVEAAEGAEAVRSNLYETSLISLAAVMILFCVAFRQPEALIFIAIPLIVGVVWTLGLSSLFVHRVTQVTLAFAAILIGLGVDFSIHFYNRFLEDIRGGHKIPESLETAITYTGPTIVAGGLTTGIAFFAMGLTRFQGFRELGLFGGIGIVMCLLAMATTLPPLMVIFSGISRRKGAPLATFGLKKVTYLVMSFPRMTVAASLCIAAYLGIYATQARFDDDFRNLQQPSEPYNQLVARIDRHFETPSNQVLVIVEDEDLERALQANDAVYRNIQAMKDIYGILAIDSLRTVSPAGVTQLASLRRFANLPFDRISDNLTQIQKDYPQIPPNFFQPAIERLKKGQDNVEFALEQGEPLLGRGRVDNPVFLRLLQSYIKRDETRGVYRVMTQVYPPKGQWIDEVPQPFLDGLATGLRQRPIVSGNAILSGELESIIITDLAALTLIVIFAIVLYLIFYFRNVSHALLAMVPVFFALVCTLGVMELLGITLNYLNVIVIPMIVGVGVDSGIHLLSRIFENNKFNMRLAIERTGRAVIITGLTTIFGFGSLSAATFRGIREIGILSIIGVSCTLFAALLFLPALIRMIDPHYRYGGGPGDEVG